MDKVISTNDKKNDNKEIELLFDELTRRGLQIIYKFNLAIRDAYRDNIKKNVKCSKENNVFFNNLFTGISKFPILIEYLVFRNISEEFLSSMIDELKNFLEIDIKDYTKINAYMMSFDYARPYYAEELGIFIERLNYLGQLIFENFQNSIELNQDIVKDSEN